MKKEQFKKKNYKKKKNKMMQMFCNNKHVLLVGNSVDGFNKKQGKIIDSFDVVVRFGKGVPDGHEEYIGSKTDVWSTGSFRSKMRNYFPSNIPVLYNSYTISKKKQTPPYPHIEMFNEEELEKLKKECPTNKRMSIGVLTALYFCTKVNTFASLTFINFDFFSKGIKFKDMKQDREALATSWHLPIVRAKYDNTESENPAHDSSYEKQIISKLLTRKDVFFIGDSNPTKEIISVDRASWDYFRQPTKKTS